MQLTLYKRVLFLIIFVIFVSLSTACILIIGISDSLISERLETGSDVISERISQSELIKRNLRNPLRRGDLEVWLSGISEATISNIVMLDEKDQVLFQYFAYPEDAPHFLSEIEKALLINPQSNAFLIKQKDSDYFVKKIFDEHEQFIGHVVVADRPSVFELNLRRESLSLILWANLIGLIVGIFGAVALSKKIKNILLGFEPEEIAKMMQERSAMLDSVREGILCVDIEGKITLVNSSARKIFSYVGLRANELVGLEVNKLYNSNISIVLKRGKSFFNQEEKINHVTVITNQVPVFISGKIVGAIMTFQLKTELEVLAQQLTGVREYADALRSQTHEFLNKMHVVLGMIKIEAYDELKEYIKNIVVASGVEAQYIRDRIEDPILSGFIIGKISRARELDIDFSLTEESFLAGSIALKDIDKLVSIIGNLLNNAFDILKSHSSERIVWLSLLSFNDELVITVEDSGPGIEEEILEQIFEKGFSTKGDNRGYGLHITKQAVEELNGSIEVESIQNEGVIFTVKLPNILMGEEEKND